MSDYRDAWLAEMWGYCRELPRHVRADKRADDRQEQRQVEEMRVVHSGPPNDEELSTGCAETGGHEVDRGAA